MNLSKNASAYLPLQPSQPLKAIKNSNRFDYLDGYRGLLCLIVIMQHAQGY